MSDITPPERRWQAIGRVTEYGTSLDGMLGELLARLMGGNLAACRRVVAAEAISWKVDRLESVANVVLEGDRRQAVLDLVRDARAASSLRNAVVHSEHWMGDDPGILKATRPRRRGEPTVAEVTQEQFDSAANALQAVVLHLHLVVLPTLGFRLDRTE